MATIEDILKKEFDSIIVDLKAKHIQLGMKASGKWVEGLENVSSGTTGKVIGEDYTYQLVNGRKEGKFPPVEAIKQWIIDKGIVNKIKGEISVSSLAFLIARKIAREGTKYYQQGGTDLVDSVVTPERIQSIINKVGIQATVNTVQVLTKQLQKIEV